MKDDSDDDDEEEEDEEEEEEEICIVPTKIAFLFLLEYEYMQTYGSYSHRTETM